MKIIYIICGAACIYLLQRALYKKYWNKNLFASVYFTQHAITELEEGELCETIVNQKYLPLPMLRVKFEVDRHLDFMQEANITVTDRCYKNDIFSVMMYQKITRRLKFIGNRRGFYAVKEIALDSSDLFMEKHLGMNLICDSWIYVYPRQTDIRRLLIPFQKATARIGELRTNLHGYTVRQEVCLLLNLQSESMIEYQQLREESIRIANSLCEMFLKQKIPIGIYSNAKDLLSGKSLNIMPGADLLHLTQIRESLARLDLSQTMEEFHEYAEKILQRVEVIQLFERLSKNCCGSYWILPLHSWMEQKLFPAKDGAVLRWEVEQNAAG